LIAPNPDSALNEEAGKMLLEAYEDYAKRARLHTSIHAQSGKSEYLRLTESRKAQKPTLPQIESSVKHADKPEGKTSSTPEIPSDAKVQATSKPGSNVLTACAINNVTLKRSAADANLEAKSSSKAQKISPTNTAKVDKKKRNLKRL
jgi:ubiquitin-conjugating enzyme E2 S